MDKKITIAPFAKQCFVTAGVTLNFAQFGLVMGFTSSLLPQLRAEDSIIPIDDSSGSWIAAVPAISMFPSNFIIPFLLGKYGRKLSCIVSVVPFIISWLMIAMATDLTTILIARLIQGVSMNISYVLSPILIGEYTSPTNRGAFLTTLSLVIGLGTHMAHTMAACLTWKTTALVCAVTAFVDLLIVLYSPESPSWLIDRGRYEDGRNVFRWLRGNGEDDELDKMIAADTALKEAKLQVNVAATSNIKSNIAYFYATIRKREFYIPIMIMAHLNILILVSGSVVLASYAVDLYDAIVGSGVNIPLMIMIVDTQRLISNMCAIYIVKKVKRKSVLLTTVALNILAFMSISGYSYAKSKNLISNYPFIGVTLIHIHMFSIATGTTPVPLIISGEIFPLRYRSLSSMVGCILMSPANFITLKTLPFLINATGLHGVYCMYGCIVLYCLIVVWILLPETKDRTLQDIENEFRGKEVTTHDDELVKLS